MGYRCLVEYIIIVHNYCNFFYTLLDLFEWINQDLVDYVNWASEPSMRQSCVEMTTDSNGLWRERLCRDHEFHYVCKMNQCKS